MKRPLCVLFFLYIVHFTLYILHNSGSVLAVFPNNKFGIHLTQISDRDLEDTAKLVNSSGGDWGYVTVVMEEGGRSKERWQGIFDKMRELHLIPIVRLATTFDTQRNCWRPAQWDDAVEWADFLDSLNWVIKNRYVILFNEPNYFREWGCKIDAVDYFRVAAEFGRVLKNKNPDFFIMLAGFNATAPHRLPEYENLENFFAILVSKASQGNTFQVTEWAPGSVGELASALTYNELFENIDGWASHVYEYNAYYREMNLLRKLTAGKNLPVFITEAGWPHAEGVKYDKNFLPETKAAKNIVNFLLWANNQGQVMAITPFVLNYQTEPFDHFSWKKQENGQSFYSQYYAVQKLWKKVGEPVQEQKLEILNDLPEKLVADSVYKIPIVIKNSGQAIWKKKEGYFLDFAHKTYEIYKSHKFFSDIEELRPFESQTVWLHLKTGPPSPSYGEAGPPRLAIGETGKFGFSLGIFKSQDGSAKLVSNSVPWNLEIIPAIKVELSIKFLFKNKPTADNFKLVVYNSKEEVVFERTGLKSQDGRISVEDVHNVTVGEKYRLVLLKPGYLPRQTFLTISEENNQAAFSPMLPFDFNNDGKFSISDLLYLIP